VQDPGVELHRKRIVHWDMLAKRTGSYLSVNSARDSAVQVALSDARPV
jgi:hypothetical protein